MSTTPHDEHVNVNIEDQNETKSSNPFIRVAIIIGIVLILLLIAFSIVKLVPKLISSFGAANVSFSSLFTPKDKITVTTDSAKVKSGSAFTVSWKNTTTDTQGSMIWSYKCVSGVTVEYNSIAGMRPVVCDTNFPLPSNGTSYSFVAKTTNKAPTVIQMTVSFWDTDLKTMKSSGSAEITVLPEGYTDTATGTTAYEPNYNTNTNTATTTGASNNNTTNTNNQVQTHTNTQSNSGTADLRISLMKIGRTASDGSYVDSTTFAENDRVTVRFNVSNVGSARSGNWTLRANLPTKTLADKVYVSGTQPALNPGDAYALTISFDAFDPNARSIEIALNASDSNQSNNILTIPVTSNGVIYNNNNGNGGSNNYGYGGNADLSVRITDVGVMDRNTSQFYPNNSINRNDKAAVKFEVQNIGGAYSGQWSFTANLPSNSNNNYYSGVMESLAPGQTKQFTIGFDNPYTGSNNVSFQINSTNGGYENNTGNNFASRTIFVNN